MVVVQIHSVLLTQLKHFQIFLKKLLLTRSGARANMLVIIL